jgi:hypothetical protein
MNFFYEVIVGNIGKVHEGFSYRKALDTFFDYVKKSSENYGRAAGEEVTLWKDGEIIKDYIPA